FVGGHGHRDDFLVEMARLLRGNRAGLGDERPLVLGLPAHFAFFGHVLGGHAHRDVHVVERALRAVHEGMELELSAAPACARDGLDAGRDVGIALARFDRVEVHPDRLQGGGAEAVDGGAGHAVVDARDQSGDAPDVVALLTLSVATTHHHVADRGLLYLRVALHDRLQWDRGEVIGAHGLERPLHGPPDGRTHGVDDHSFRHLVQSPWLGEPGDYRSSRDTPSSSKPTWCASSWRTVLVT